MALWAASPALLASARAAAAGGTGQADFLKVLRRKRASLEEAESAAEGLRAAGHLSGVRGYSSAIVASSRGRKWSVAMELFDEMLERGLRPTASAFTALREACEEGGQAALAARVLVAQGSEAPQPRQAKTARTQASPSTVPGVLYSKGALCTRLREKDAAPERLLEATELLRSGGHFQETLSYTTALRNCEHGHHWDLALSLLSEMRDRTVRSERRCLGLLAMATSLVDFLQFLEARGLYSCVGWLLFITGALRRYAAGMVGDPAGKSLVEGSPLFGGLLVVEKRYHFSGLGLLSLASQACARPGVLKWLGGHAAASSPPPSAGLRRPHAAAARRAAGAAAALCCAARGEGRGGNGWSALHYAATGRCVETCRVLLDHGAEVEALSLDGCTPFYYAYRAGDEVEQDVVTYNVAVAACGRGQQWERSLALLETMSAVDIPPDFETYQAASLACSRNGEWEQALTFLAIAQAMKVANAESWHIGMMACASAGAWEATLEMLESAGSAESPKDVSRDLMCYGVALYACMESGRWPKPYGKVLVGSVALVLALIVPCCGFLGAKTNNRSCICCFACCNCCGGCLHILQAILIILIMVGLGSVETYCRQPDSCEGIMKACKYHKSDLYALSTYEGCLDYLVSMFPAAYAGLGVALGLTCLAICFQCASARWGKELYDVLAYEDLCLGSDSDGVDADAVALACAAQACRDGRNSDAANEIISEMRLKKMNTNVAEVLNEATLSVDFPEVRSPVPLGALRPMAPKEVNLYKWIRQRATPGDVASVIQVIEEFAEDRSWLKIQGEQKKELLEASLRPEDRVVEFGCYVGYSSMVMAKKLRELGGGSVTTCEVDAANAYVARGVLQFAGVEGEVQVRVGCACDWVATGQLGTIDFLLLDHRGTIYHDDLHAAEPSLSEKALVFADNVLYPGAPLFLNYIDVQGYQIEIHELKEFKRPDLDDWVVICRPPPVAERREMPESTPAELRRLSAEVDAISWRSQEQSVDWVAFQTRLKPIFYQWKEERGL
eukprot:s771_g7.t3